MNRPRVLGLQYPAPMGKETKSPPVKNSSPIRLIARLGNKVHKIMLTSIKTWSRPTIQILTRMAIPNTGTAEKEAAVAVTDAIAPLLTLEVVPDLDHQDHGDLLRNLKANVASVLEATQEVDLDAKDVIADLVPALGPQAALMIMTGTDVIELSVQNVVGAAEVDHATEADLTVDLDL